MAEPTAAAQAEREEADQVIALLRQEHARELDNLRQELHKAKSQAGSVRKLRQQLSMVEGHLAERCSRGSRHDTSSSAAASRVDAPPPPPRVVERELALLPAPAAADEQHGSQPREGHPATPTRV